MALPQVVLQCIKQSFKGAHFGAKKYWISPASLWNFTIFTTLLYILTCSKKTHHNWMIWDDQKNQCNMLNIPLVLLVSPYQNNHMESELLLCSKLSLCQSAIVQVGHLLEHLLHQYFFPAKTKFKNPWSKEKIQNRSNWYPN